jgi:histidine ammonia-lyase
MESVVLNGQNLKIKDIYNIATAKPGAIKLSIDENALKRMHESRTYIEQIVKDDKAVYGINTGFGALSDKHIPRDQLAQLQVNLIRSHCTGVGKPFSREITRAIMLLRANCLISGFSGVSPHIVELILEFLNHDINPVVPEKGSVGASGDLAPLSHIALALIGEGEVLYEGKVLSSAFVLEQKNLKPAVLGPKDGLALINGTAVMAALGCLGVVRAQNLLKIADIVCGMTLEGVKGTRQAYNPLISSLKPHPGQVDCCANLNTLLSPSEIMKSHTDCGKVQDPYSLRCVPQVHGACRQTWHHAKEVIEREVNAVTDNPLVFMEENLVISGGNFHGQALSFAMDYLAMGMAEICSISERRVEKMMNPTFSGLPAFLTAESGINSGFMIAHVTSAALTSENKFLCHPASVDSVPTSTDKEDHVSMGVTAGRKLHEVLDNVENVLAIELICAAQAIEFHRPLKSSDAIEAAHHMIRCHVEPLGEDRILHKDMANIASLIRGNDILNAVEETVGELK